MTDYIPQMEPLIAEADGKAVQAYMASGGWLTEFEKSRELEAALCKFTGAQWCSLAPNGTLALFLALMACGIKRDDEVMVPALTMAATATAPLLAGARVVFADIEPRTLCLDLARAEHLFSPRTRAVIVVSLNGRAPAGLADFVARCRKRGIKVIEDAAQSLGSFAGDRHLGTLGDAGCFSFSAHKVVTTGQGGAVITNDEEIAGRMKRLRDFGRAQGGADRYESVGWNFKFTDLQAVVGLEQMRRVPSLVARKKHVFERYREGLAGIRGISMPETDLVTTTPLFADVLVDPELKPRLGAHLHRNAIGSRSFYPALHREPAFATGEALPVAEAASARGLWLPSSMRLEDAHIDQVCRSIRHFFAS